MAIQFGLTSFPLKMDISYKKSKAHLKYKKHSNPTIIYLKKWSEKLKKCLMEIICMIDGRKPLDVVVILTLS